MPLPSAQSLCCLGSCPDPISTNEMPFAQHNFEHSISVLMCGCHGECSYSGCVERDMQDWADIAGVNLVRDPQTRCVICLIDGLIVEANRPLGDGSRPVCGCIHLNMAWILTW